MRRRRHYFVDPQVQGALLARVLCYFAVCLVSATQVLICYLLVPDLPIITSRFMIPVLLCTFALLPIFLVDFVRITNKIAGPMVRLRKVAKLAANGEPVEPIKVRQGDYWEDFIQDFNRLVERGQDVSTHLGGRPS